MPPRHTASRRAASAAIFAAALAMPALSATAAHADDCKKGNPFSCTGTSTGSGSGGSGGSGGSSGGAPSGPVAPPPPEELNDNEATGFVPVDGGDPAPAAPTTLDWVEVAKSAAELPAPVVHTAPDGKTFVKVRTSLWVDGYRVVKTRPVGGDGQTVQATATPVSVTWNLGETQKTCKNPGTKDGKACNHTYRRASAGQPGGAYQITATITWNLTWECEGPACDPDGGELGPETMTSPPTPLVVSEIQTNTGQ